MVNNMCLKEKILIIEDEYDIQILLSEYLEQEGYLVDFACNGLEGMEKFQNNIYDLILVDIMMPKIDGYLVLEMIRQVSKVPVIMITAMDSENDQIKAFDLRADDYIVKPFSMKLVLRRIKAIMRRGDDHQGKILETHILQHGKISLNTKSLEITISEKLIKITKKEFSLLQLLMQNPKQVFTREMLLEQVWGYDFYGNPKIVNIHMQNLRKKLGGNYIETVRGMGYRLDEKEKK